MKIIWWLTQADCEVIGSELSDAFPEDVRRMYMSRHGRAGRGRLWTPPGVTASVDPWPDTPLAETLVRKDAGGLVVERDLLPLLADLPGVVTDMKLQRV